MPGPVLVGVAHGFRPGVPRRAAELAAMLGSDLLCVRPVVVLPAERPPAGPTS
ncbi:hypothetical protein [Isoptericola hypogeus]